MAALRVLAAAVGLMATATAAPYSSNAALNQLALQQVVSDSSAVFGNPNTTNSPYAHWMAAFPDHTPLAHMNIPGTHDAHTWNYSQATQDSTAYIESLVSNDPLPPAAYRCQRASISDSLAAGVRFFDLRYAFDVTKTSLVFWHNAALMSERANMENVLYAFYAWLDAHPTETVLLSFQYEGSTFSTGSNDADVQRLLYGLLKSAAAKKYIVQARGVLPTLGEARGKAVLMRRFDLDQLPASYDDSLPGLHFSPADWTDDSPDIVLVYNATTNATLYVEDYYEPDDIPLTANATVNIDAKLNATVSHLRKAATQYPDSLFITFTSGGHLQSNAPVTPEIMAVGNASDPSTTPDGGVNQQLVPVLKSLKGKRLGVVVLDFWDEPVDLVGLIIGR